MLDFSVDDVLQLVGDDLDFFGVDFDVDVGRFLLLDDDFFFFLYRFRGLVEELLVPLWDDDDIVGVHTD